MIPFLEGWPTQAKKAPSPRELGLTLLDTNPVIQCLRYNAVNDKRRFWFSKDYNAIPLCSGILMMAFSYCVQVYHKSKRKKLELCIDLFHPYKMLIRQHIFSFREILNLSTREYEIWAMSLLWHLKLPIIVPVIIRIKFCQIDFKSFPRYAA